MDCLDCSKYLTCRDKKKAKNYRCEKFSKKTLRDISEILSISSVLDEHGNDEIDMSDVEGENKKKRDPGFILADEKTNVSELIESVINSDLLTPIDTKIDDSAAPSAKNFYEFTTGQHFLNVKPYAFQMLYITQLFAEYCVTGDTLLVTHNGICRVDQLNAGKYSDYSGKTVTLDGQANITAAGITKHKSPYLIIKTANSTTLKVTSNHRVLTLAKDYSLRWKEAGDLTTDDWLVEKLGANLWPEKPPKINRNFEYSGPRSVKSYRVFAPKRLTPELARLAGYLISDGYVDKYSFGFTNNDPKLIDDFLYCLSTITEYPAKVRYNGTHIDIDSIYVTQFINSLGIKTGNCYNKIVPDFILSAPRDLAIEFIRAVIDCDGYIQTNRVGIAMANSKVIQVLKLMLQNLGIHCNMFKYYTYSTKYGKHKNKVRITNYKIEIYDYYAKIFSDIIGSKHSLKQAVQHAPREFSYHRDTYGRLRPGLVPFGKDFAALGLDLRTHYHEKMPRLKSNRTSVYSIDEILDSEYLSYLESRGVSEIRENLKRLKNLNLAFSRVESVKHSKKLQDVYDITVPDGENFLANGVIVHNCPRCSDTKWMREGIKVDDSLALFYKKVKLLEFGVCPKCGATKSHLVKEGELNFYQELAGLAGQRCIAGESVIFTDAGMVHVDELDNGLDFEFNEVESFILNGDFDIVPNHAIYKCYPEESYRVELENGMWIEGTKEHPIYTANGYVPIIMSEGELVPVRFDFEAFGKERLSLNIAKFLGYWIACGSTCSLQTTNADAFEAVKALFPQAFKIEDQIIFDYSHSFSRMSELLGYSPNYVEDRRYVPKNVRSADRASVLVFLQAFFAEASVVSNNVITVVCKSKRIQLSIASYLQMFGVRYLIKGQNIEIDGESNQFFTRTFNLPRVGNTISEYDSYEYDEEEDVYWIPVKSISRSFFQVTYDFVVPGTHDFVANGFIQHNSGKSAITAMSCAYLLHKQLKLQKPNEVYGLLPANVLHGTFVALTYKQAAETLWEPFLAYVTDSPWFCIEENTLIRLADGTEKRIKDIKVGDLVKTSEGENEVVNVFDNNRQECKRITLQNGSYVEATDEHKIRCLSVDGKSLVWKKVSEITCEDYVVTG